MSESKPRTPKAEEMPTGFTAETWGLLTDAQKQAYLNPGQDEASRAAMSQADAQIAQAKKQLVVQGVLGFLMASLRRVFRSLIGR